MKQVLVWIGYGNVEVHPAETVEDFRKIIATVLEMTEEYREYDEDSYSFAETALENTPDDMKNLKRAFGFLAQSSLLIDNESFETFELVEVKEL